MAKKKNDLPFEEAMEKLEEVVEQLEAGEVPLEKAIALFQEGMELSRTCSSKLSDVEQKIEMLLEQEGEQKVVPFELEGEEE
ncbi:exodeoxyribonuclease VII small subunit [Aneurinibacillus tyrosinisolvens]|jgi:exodeoxyribonuclease VII small subunit|uniref:exodeoxyribonuclease VII small subunit n=1 Tax=Aneurinibacillus tyrosinisolvens TaxID=1443435 RepID=UPI00063FA270|nr:exodeoxyribonuclease VII small subunit [Aneurinibacillus tyrosinisolvens]